jgi:hypothetical protein
MRQKKDYSDVKALLTTIGIPLLIVFLLAVLSSLLSSSSINKESSMKKISYTYQRTYYVPLFKNESEKAHFLDIIIKEDFKNFGKISYECFPSGIEVKEFIKNGYYLTEKHEIWNCTIEVER